MCEDCSPMTETERLSGFMEDQTEHFTLMAEGKKHNVITEATARNWAGAYSDTAALMRDQAEELAILKRLLIGSPRWRCTKCGGYSDGSGEGACPHCKVWYYRTGSFEWPYTSIAAQVWQEQATKRLERQIAQMKKARKTPRRTRPRRSQHD